METEQQAYEVPGQQMRWRAAQLNAQGYPFQAQYAGGVYIVIVQQPPGVDPFAYQPPPRQRQHWPAWDGTHLMRWGIVLALVALMLGAVYMAMGSTADEGAPVATQEDGGPLSWLASGRFPWQEDAATQPDPAPFRWPWENAADTLAELVGDVQSTVTMVAGAIVTVLVLMIVWALMRKARGRQ